MPRRVAVLLPGCMRGVCWLRNVAGLVVGLVGERKGSNAEGTFGCDIQH